MPLHLDNNDIAIIKSLSKDGRKSFRQISREIGITTPTVKARFERLVNIGFIKGVLPVFDFNKVDNTDDVIPIQNIKKDNARETEYFDKNGNNNKFEEEINKIEKKITTGLAINLVCDYCHGQFLDNLEFLNLQTWNGFFVAILVKLTIVKNIKEE